MQVLCQLQRARGISRRFPIRLKEKQLHGRKLAVAGEEIERHEFGSLVLPVTGVTWRLPVAV